MDCIICGSREGVSGDHIKTFGSGGECCEGNLWALCFNHHREKHDKGLTEFVDKYSLREILIDKGWFFEEFMQRWIRKTKEGLDD